VLFECRSSSGPCDLVVNSSNRRGPWPTHPYQESARGGILRLRLRSYLLLGQNAPCDTTVCEKHSPPRRRPFKFSKAARKMPIQGLESSLCRYVARHRLSLAKGLILPTLVFMTGLPAHLSSRCSICGLGAGGRSWREECLMRCAAPRTVASHADILLMERLMRQLSLQRSLRVRVRKWGGLLDASVS
jgi:hypothetical protein